MCRGLVMAAVVVSVKAQTPATPSAGQDEAPTVLQMTVRRVVLDVVVTDANGAPVSGLTEGDFTVTEDGKPQKIVAFDAAGFSADMDYVPPSLPPQPAGTYINLPATPEKGPLYVLLYDLVNMDSADQMNTPMDHSAQLFARKQLIKFIESKPEGTRFAIFVRSDGLHLVQGFTADKALLYRAVDPHNPRAHIPVVFLNGENFGRGDRMSALDTLHSIATYLDGLSGRKNLIWFASQFPLSLFAADTDGVNFQEETKATLDLLAHDQIALYPVDGRGVPYQDSHAQIANSPHSDTVTSPQEAGSGGPTGSGAVGNSPSTSSSFVQGSSVVNDSFNTMDGIARETGGQAFYGFNDVAQELVKATEGGEMYYTLAYAPTNLSYDGKVRKIHVALMKKGYALSYRRSYYGTETQQAAVAATADQYAVPRATKSTDGKSSRKDSPAVNVVKDSLSAHMEYGAPEEHQLVFVVEAQAVGAPAEGTTEQMAELATEPAYFKSRRRSAAVVPLRPIPLQKDLFSFNIPTGQFKGERSLNLELAAGAYDAEGRLMNAFVRIAKKDLEETPGAPDSLPFFRVEQELEVPVGATSLRVAVRDATNDRTGAMEIALPLPRGQTGR
ncbi:MAG: VWA domain-containing protein [Acidobacteriaceae bacterium]